MREFILETSSDPSGLRPAAAASDALPSFFDMSACYAVRPNGEVIVFEWGGHDEIRVESELHTRNISLFQGSKKYPELEGLIKKPADAVVCPHCQGAGREPTIEKLGLKNVLCYCGGLGWLP